MSFSRRAFLRTGLAATALPRFLRAGQDAPRRVKGVIWLWMGGGMSAWETWDPKPGAASGSLKAIDTAVPGLQLSELMPVCASQMKHLSILRTVSHREGDLERAAQLMYTGIPPEAEPFPGVGSIVSSQLSPPDSPLPGYLQMDSPNVPPSALLGESHLPFRLNHNLNPIPNLRRNVDANRDRERIQLLEEQNRDWAALRQQPEVKRTEVGIARSEALMTHLPFLKALNWETEPDALRQAYGGKFGQDCLLARRLVQAGCAFVELGFGGWSAKSDHAGLMKVRVPELDRALGTLVKDLAEKDLLRDVLVVCATEFGRTPDRNAGGGRDRWSRAFSVAMAGGALVGGRAHGSTGANGQACEPAVSVPDFLATVYRACGIDPEKEYAVDDEARTMKFGQGGKPVAELFPA